MAKEGPPSQGRPRGVVRECGARVVQRGVQPARGTTGRRVYFAEAHPGKLCTRIQQGGTLAGLSRERTAEVTVSVGASLQSGNQNAGERIEVGDDRQGFYKYPPAARPSSLDHQESKSEKKSEKKRLKNISIFRR